MDSCPLQQIRVYRLCDKGIWGGNVAAVVECLLSIQKALLQFPELPRKKKKKFVPKEFGSPPTTHIEIILAKFHHLEFTV